MNTGKTLFAQLMDFLTWTTFARYVARYDGDKNVRTLVHGGDKVCHWSGGDVRLRRSKIQPVVRQSFVLGTKGSRRDVCRGGLRGGSTICFQ